MSQPSEITWWSHFQRWENRFRSAVAHIASGRAGSHSLLSTFQDLILLMAPIQWVSWLSKPLCIAAFYWVDRDKVAKGAKQWACGIQFLSCSQRTHCTKPPDMASRSSLVEQLKVLFSKYLWPMDCQKQNPSLLFPCSMKQEDKLDGTQNTNIPGMCRSEAVGFHFHLLWYFFFQAWDTIHTRHS